MDRNEDLLTKRVYLISRRSTYTLHVDIDDRLLTTDLKLNRLLFLHSHLNFLLYLLSYTGFPFHLRSSLIGPGTSDKHS